MAQADINKLKAIREKTKAGVSDIRMALEEADNNEEKALALLKKWGLKKAAGKGEREVGAGTIETYMHANGRVGAMVDIACETDFVAKTDDFKQFAHNVAMQVAAMGPESVDDLLNQTYIKDSKQTINDLRRSLIAKLGENVQIKRFARLAVGEE